jgi:hypothetical protein
LKYAQTAEKEIGNALAVVGDFFVFIWGVIEEFFVNIFGFLRGCVPHKNIC